MHPYLFRVGSFELRIYSLMLMIAVVVALYFAGKRVKRLNMDSKMIENAVIIIFLGAIAGARLYYVIFNWAYFSRKPAEIFAVWHGGLAIHGGIISGIITAFILCRYKKISLFFICDLLSPFVILGQGIGRFGNFANGEAHGTPTITPPGIIFQFKPIFPKFWDSALTQMQTADTPTALTALFNKIAAIPQTVTFQGQEYLLKEYVPWGVSFPAKYMSIAYREFGSMPVHPTFFYEMIFNFICAFLLILLWRKDSNIGTGKIFALYLVMYAVIRGFVTFFRADDLMFGQFRAPHIASASMIFVAAVWCMCAKYFRKKSLV
ncbi:MAG: prolipoprotein diacylglyceryl transferase [Deferribacteraceae bacterium]|jgi:phosphatidylglycerol:prolipoprotein diacylglycerol transferase|nr:prolipoprotein diacylglyceryl transferase [Deferribacteraceae bacterium]